MFSLLRRGLVYEDINPDIVEHDEDIDAHEWSYNGRDVYRGRADPRYRQNNLNVHWLYDDDINKVGLVEYDAIDPTVFSVLWFRDNKYATLFQDDRWVSKDKTIWSVMPYEAYLDCLEDDFSTVFDRCLSSKYRLITPEILYDPPTVYSCTNCHKKSIKPLTCHKQYIKKDSYFDYKSFIFIDDSYIVYERSTMPQSASSEREQKVVEEPKPDLQE
jgi:hypothetical protein